MSISQGAPFFSVVIPAYNAARFLGETIESVLAQTFRDLEIVVCDNASTDGTPEVIRRYEGRVRAVRLEVNRGPAGGRNAALAAARGRYVAFLDADDLWARDKLEVSYSRIAEQNARFVFSNSINIDSRGRLGAPGVSARRRQLVIQPRDPLFLLVNFVTCSSAVVDAQLLQGRRFNEDPSMYTMEDYLLWLELNQEIPLFYISRPLVYRRLHGANSAIGYRDLAYLQRLLDVVEGEGLYPPETIHLARAVMRLRTLAYGEKRARFIGSLLALLLRSRGQQQRLVGEWLLFYLRHLRAGAIRKWASWPVTGRPKEHF